MRTNIFRVRAKDGTGEEGTATQWNKVGDHVEVRRMVLPASSNTDTCTICFKDLSEHGEIGSGHEYDKVCPGNYIVNEECGEWFLLTEEEFLDLYERI